MAEQRNEKRNVAVAWCVPKRLGSYDLLGAGPHRSGWPNTRINALNSRYAGGQLAAAASRYAEELQRRTPPTFPAGGPL